MFSAMALQQLIHSPNDLMRPPSPSLTNPDMILPYENPSRESTPTPTLDSGTHSGLSGAETVKQKQLDADSRPGMPGEWQSEISIRSSPSVKSAKTLSGPVYSTGSWRPARDHARDVSSSASSRTEARAAEKTPEEEEPERDPFSQLAFLRAEEILANAKKRLSTMESNLTRARSISITRSPSTSSATNKDQSPGSPPNGLGGNGWAISAAKLRQTSFNSSAVNGGHARVASETALSNAKTTLSGRRLEGDRYRSSSAMGSKELDRGYTSDDFGGRKQRHLEPLHEDELVPPVLEDYSYRDSPSSGQSTISRLQDRSPSQLSHAKSNVQLRDLREQMQDLKGKVHSLKQRTREDTLQRRSMQMLKSPTPFTDADAWSNPGTSSGRNSALKDEIPKKVANNLGEQASEEEPTTIDDSSPHGSQSDSIPRRPSTGSVWSQPEAEQVFDKRHSRFEPGEFYFGSPTAHQTEFITPAKGNEGSDSPKDLPDHTGKEEATDGPLPSEIAEAADESQTTPLSHEDRPDAFDYETFVLNSTMGSYSRQGRRPSDSSSSNSTIGPVHSSMDDYSSSNNFQDAQSTLSLTTSPPRAKASRPNYHTRQSSTDSVSTVATFATAYSGDDDQARPNSRTQTRTLSQAAVQQNSYLTPSYAPAIVRPPSTASFSRPRPPSSAYHNADRSISPTFESTSIKARSQILSTLLAEPTDQSSRASPDVLLAILPEDEASIRAVIEGLQRCCGRLIRGDNISDVKKRLEHARRALDGMEEEGLEF